MADPILLKYRAFISYRHANMSRAKWLQSQLEGFSIDKDMVMRGTGTGTTMVTRPRNPALSKTSPCGDDGGPQTKRGGRTADRHSLVAFASDICGEPA
jgi:hypothetical protein